MQAAISECQVTTGCHRLRLPCGTLRLCGNSKEVSFNTLCDPDSSLLVWGLEWWGWRLLEARCGIPSPALLSICAPTPTFPAWPCSSPARALDPSRGNGPLFRPGPGRAL